MDGVPDVAGDVALEAFDDANQLCSTASTAGTCSSPAGGATVFDFDNRGNRIELDPASGPTVTYDYDQANRLVAHDDGTDAWTYAYRPDGLRSASDDGSDPTTFTWEQASGLPALLAETTGGDTTYYLYGPNGPAYAEIDPTGEVSYLHHDQLGSTRLLTDDTGAITGTATYDAYGTPTATGITSNLGYAGQYTDPTGLQFLRARYYDPHTGQFVTRDPIEPITRDAYGYANRTPINAMDPSGLYCEWWHDDCDLQPVADYAGGVVDGLGLGHGDVLLTGLGLGDNWNPNSPNALAGQVTGFGIVALGAGVATASGDAVALTNLTRASRASSAVTVVRTCAHSLDGWCVAQGAIGAASVSIPSNMSVFGPGATAWTSLTANEASAFAAWIQYCDQQMRGSR